MDTVMKSLQFSWLATHCLHQNHNAKWKILKLLTNGEAEELGPDTMRWKWSTGSNSDLWNQTRHQFVNYSFAIVSSSAAVHGWMIRKRMCLESQTLWPQDFWFSPPRCVPPFTPWHTKVPSPHEGRNVGSDWLGLFHTFKSVGSSHFSSQVPQKWYTTVRKFVTPFNLTAALNMGNCQWMPDNNKPFILHWKLWRDPIHWDSISLHQQQQMCLFCISNSGQDRKRLRIHRFDKLVPFPR